jgi:hypothetical protein
MHSSSADEERGVESELIDLSTVSMIALRKLDNAIFRQMLQSVMQEASHPRVTAGGGSGQRID